ncbi:MAG: hypothetical protein DWG76_01805 [Chloroflexi bacterium]|nr:serine hydrolase [Chloroflexota bacterium]MQC26168.1 hypothetical protein [Chloroflexota bacterium]
MKSQTLSRRDFLKLASMGLISASGLRGARLIGLAGQPLSGKPRWRPLPPENTDVLSEAQKARLIAASREFLAADEQAANQVALDIDFIEGANEHSSTMCGPLSISILRSAELLGIWAKPRDFWLLNPREDHTTAPKVFPKELYYWYEFEEPISEFDFQRTPLLAGDMLYLDAAPGDTFEHMLVVNRVDDRGRAYSVSNFFTETGTLIEDRMLYDPASKGEGQIYRWADRRYRNTIGTTGSGGFRIWRVKDGRSLELPTDPANVRLHGSLDELLFGGEGEWFASIKEVGGAQLYQFNPFEVFHPASTIKVLIALGFYAWLEDQKVRSFDDFITERGTAGRTYQQLLRAMIVESEEKATEALVGFLGAEWLEEVWEDWGLNASRANPRRSRAIEVAEALEGLYTGKWITAESRGHLLGLMAEYTKSDEGRLGLIRGKLPTGSVIYNKRGSLVEAPRVVADSGIIQIGASGPAYIFSLHGLGRDGSSYEALEATLDEAVLAFGEFLTSV